MLGGIIMRMVKYFASRNGFGLLEVMAAAVVLGFLIIGLTRLQIGNRESILRVRARDAANVIAQEVIDSVSSLGSASVKIEKRECKDDDEDTQDLCRSRIFKGATGDIPMNYRVMVYITEDQSQKVGNNNEQGYVMTSDYIKATASSGDAIKVERLFAKRVEVTVSWDFRNTTQSINMSTVIR